MKKSNLLSSPMPLVAVAGILFLYYKVTTDKDNAILKIQEEDLERKNHEIERQQRRKNDEIERQQRNKSYEIEKQIDLRIYNEEKLEQEKSEIQKQFEQKNSEIQNQLYQKKYQLEKQLEQRKKYYEKDLIQKKYEILEPKKILNLSRRIIGMKENKDIKNLFTKLAIINERNNDFRKNKAY